MSTTLGHFHHVGVVVRDLNESIGWYCRHLGFEKLSEYEFPGVKVALVGNDHLRIEFFQAEGAAPTTSQREARPAGDELGAINHFAIVVEDLDGALTELATAGVDIVSQPMMIGDDRGDRFAFIHDNERMLIELYECAADTAVSS